MCRRRDLANHSRLLRYPPGVRRVPFCPIGSASRRSIVVTPASKDSTCAYWQRRASAHWSWVALVIELPSRRRQPCQVSFAGRPCVFAVAQPVGATGLEITGGQRPQMSADQPQHLLVLRGQALETVTDRHTSRAGGHERHSDGTPSVTATIGLAGRICVDAASPVTLSEAECDMAIILSDVPALCNRSASTGRALLLCQGAFVLGPLALWPGDAMGLPATIAVIAVLGTAFAGLQLFAFSLVPDVVDAAESRGTARAGRLHRRLDGHRRHRHRHRPVLVLRRPRHRRLRLNDRRPRHPLVGHGPTGNPHRRHHRPRRPDGSGRGVPNPLRPRPHPRTIRVAPPALASGAVSPRVVHHVRLDSGCL